MGGGSATVKAVARHSLNTPKKASSSLTIFAIVIALLCGVRSSTTVLDDVSIAVLGVLLCLAIYLQMDWLMPFAERVSHKVVWRIPTTKAVAALTIDDVPLFDHPTRLEEILDVLKRNEVTATFMIMSGFALPHADGGMEDQARQRCHDLLKRAVAEGHELANHLQFDRPAISMTDMEFDEAFRHCDSLIAEISGEDSWRSRHRRWFRPASAVWNDHMLTHSEAHGYTTVLGNCHPFDAADASRHLNSAYLKARVKPGSIVIVHDRWHTPRTLEVALPMITKRLKLVTLSELQRVAEEHPGEANAAAGKEKDS